MRACVRTWLCVRGCIHGHMCACAPDRLEAHGTCPVGPHRFVVLQSCRTAGYVPEICYQLKDSEHVGPRQDCRHHEGPGITESKTIGIDAPFHVTSNILYKGAALVGIIKSQAALRMNDACWRACLTACVRPCIRPCARTPCCAVPCCAAPRHACCAAPRHACCVTGQVCGNG